MVVVLFLLSCVLEEGTGLAFVVDVSAVLLCWCYGGCVVFVVVFFGLAKSVTLGWGGVAPRT